MDNSLLALKIIAVSLKLKFKCRLRVECKGGTSTRDVDSSNGLYLFQEDIRAASSNSQIQLNFALLTEKGSHYSGGVLKLKVSDAKKNEGAIMKMPLLKCIDKQAWCQFQVKPLQTNFLNRTMQNVQQKLTSHQIESTSALEKRRTQYINPRLSETQSEQSFNSQITPLNIIFNQREGSSTKRKSILGQDSNLKTDRYKSRNISPTNRSYTSRNSPELIQFKQKTEAALEQAQIQSTRAKKIQIKLKHEGLKLKEEQQKRRALQSTQHNYKLEIMKLRMSKDKGDHELQRKNMRMKELLVELQRHKQAFKQLNKAKEEIAAKQSQIEYLNEQIFLSSKQLTETKSTVQLQFRQFEQQIRKFKIQKEKLVKRGKERQIQLQSSLKISQQEVSQLKAKISDLEAELLKVKNTMFISFAKDQPGEINSESLSAKKQIDSIKQQSKMIISEIERQKEGLKKQLALLRSEQQKEKATFLKVVSQKRLIQSDQAELQTKLAQAKKQEEKNRLKLQEQLEKNEILREENQKIKKKFQLMYEEIKKLEEYRGEEFESNQQQMQQINQKYREALTNADTLEEELKIAKMQVERQQRNEAILNKEISNFKEREKNIKIQFSRKQAECIQLKGELEALSHKIMQKMETSSQNTPNFSFLQLQDQLQDQKMDKIVSMYEAQQKYLEMQVVNEKQRSTELTSHINQLKEQLEKWTRQQQQWHQQQRNWDKQIQKHNLQLSQWNKLQKELLKKISEEEQKAKMTFEKIQKEKKLIKNLQQKYQLLEQEYKSSKEEIDNLKNQLAAAREKSKTFQHEIDLLKAELEYFDGERKKYVKNNEELQFQLRTNKEHLSLVNLKIREHQEKSNLDNKKFREEVVKYENKLKTLKLEGDKFKQALRKILMQFIALASNGAQEDHTTSAKKLKQEKLSLTLTNQLLFKLQELLKDLMHQKGQLEAKLSQVQKQFSQSRQDFILKSNQAQNSEAQLKQKLNEFIANYENMKHIFEEREEAAKKALEQNEWNINRLSQEIKSVNDIRQHLSLQLNSKSQQFVIAEEMYNHQKQQMNCKLGVLEQNLRQLSSQMEAMQGYCFKLEENLSQIRQQKQSWQIEKVKLNEQINKANQQLEVFQEKITQANKAKTLLKQTLVTKQTQIEQAKLINQQLKQDLQSYKKQKNQGSSLARNLIKEKEELLKKHLNGEQKIAALQNQLFLLNNSLAQLQEEIKKLNEKVDSLKEINQNLSSSKQVLASNLSIKEQNISDLSLQIINIQKLLTQKQESLSQLSENRAKQAKNYQNTISSQKQVIKQLQNSNTLINRQIVKLNQKLRDQQTKYQQICQQLIQQKKINEEIKLHLTINQQKFTQFIEAEKKYQIEQQSLKNQLASVKQQLDKVSTQLADRDLKNYQLSSEKYEAELQSNQYISSLENKISDMQAQMIKYSQLREQYLFTINDQQAQLELARTTCSQNELQLLKYQAKVKTLEENTDMTDEKNKNLEYELKRSKDEAKNLRNQLIAQQHKNHDHQLQFQDKISKKQAENHKLKSENQTLLLNLRRTEEKSRNIEAELQSSLKKSMIDAENSRKLEQTLRKLKQSGKNGEWNIERQIKKVINTKMLVVKQLEQSELKRRVGQALKGMEEGILQILKKYKQF